MALQPLPSGTLLDGEAPPLRPLDPTVRLDGEMSPDWMTAAAQGRGAGVQGDINRPLVGARGAMRSTLPALGGAAAFGPGFVMGGTAGAGVGSLGGPGGAAIGGTVGGLLGGIVSAMGGAALVSKAQDAVTQYIPEDIKAIFGQDAATQAQDRAEHPIAEFVGSLTPQLLSMRPGFGPAPVVAADASRLTKALASPVTSHAIGGGIGGAIEAGTELYDTGTVDPLKVGIATAFGAALNRPTTLGGKLIEGTGNATIKGMQVGARAAGNAYRGTQSLGAAAVQAAKNRFGPASEAVIDAQAIRPTATATGTEPIGSPVAALPAVSLPAQAGTPPSGNPVSAAGVPGTVDLSHLDDNFIGAITSAIYDSKMVGENGDTRAMLTPDEMQTLRLSGITISPDGTIPAADVQRLMDERAARQDKKYGAPAGVEPLPNGVPLDGEPPNPAGELGDGEKYVSTPAGNYVRTRFEVVPAASLTAATGDLQNRDRSRDSTDLQVQNIVSQFDPTRLGDSAESDRGAPIVGPDGIIESGNGRVMALNKIHGEYPPQRQAYIDHIESLGYSTAGIENPILIRRRMNDMTPEQRRQFVIESNKDAKLAMTSVEQARSDADNLDDDLLTKFKGGDIETAGNAEFVRGFMGKLTTGESAALVGPDGTISVDGIRRISNAMMARAYEDQHLLSKMIEAKDNNIKSIGGALLDNSGAWSGLRAAIKAGDVKPEYDVTKQLVEAARKVSDARAAGQHINDVLSQNDAFNPMDPIVEGFIRAFYNSTMRNAAGRDAIGSVIQRYVQLASEQTTAPSMFGDSEATTPALLLTRALTERNEAKNGGLFNQAAEDRAGTPSADMPTPLPTLDAEAKRVGPLSRFGASMWRETRIGKLDELLPSGRTQAEAWGYYNELFVANHPDHATGQGNNRGAMIEFDAAALNGKPDLSKPASDFAWSEGRAEFKTQTMRQREIQQAVRAVTIYADAQGSKTERIVTANALRDLEKAGWTKENNSDGSVTYRRPEDVSLNAAENNSPAKGQANEGNDTSGAPQRDEGGDAGQHQGLISAAQEAGKRKVGTNHGQRSDGSNGRRRRTSTGGKNGRDDQTAYEANGQEVIADYGEAFSDASFTNRTSVYNSAAAELGLTPDEFALLPGPRQVALLSRLITDTFGVPVTVEGGLQDRFAIDQMLDAYQNVQGMASVLGISNRAISLGGRLSIHLEKTGRSYLGAFAPGENKIMLPGRTNSFAHEWGHALDYRMLQELTAEQARGITGLIRKEGADFEPVNVKQAFVDLLNAMYFDKAALAAHVMDLERQIATTKSASVKAKAQAQIDRIKDGSSKTSKAKSNFWLGAKSFDGPGGDYWTSPTEMFARAFEAFVSYRAALADLGTEFIGKGDANYLAGAEERFVKTFPKGAERELIFQKFGTLFDMLTKEDLLAGPAAERPLPSQDGLPPEPREAGWLQRAVDDEVGAWADRRRQREKTTGRAKNPRTLGQKTQDVAGFFGFGMTAEMKMLGRRYGSATVMRLHDMLEFTTGDGTRTQTRGFTQAVRLLEHNLGNRLHKAWEDYAPREGASKRPRELDKAETQQLRDLLISEDVPDASPQMKALAASIRKIMDDTFYLLHNVGVKVGYTRNGYLPRLVDMGRVLADEGGFITRAAEVYELMLTRAAEAEHAKAVKAAEEAGEDPPEYEEQDFTADAEEMAARWLHALKSAAPEEFDAKSPAADFTKSRTMPVEADKIMEDFYVNDPMEAVGNYLRMASRRIEFARRFGPKGEVLSQMYKAMSAEGVDGADLETIQTITNIVVGHGATQIKHPTIRSVSSALRFLYGTAALLPRATFSSLHEGLTAGIVMGNPKYGIMTLKAQIEQLLGTATAKERRDIAMICGMIQAGTGSQILAERMGGEFADDTVWGKLSDRMYYNIGLTAYTRHQQTAMIAPAHAFLYVLGRDIMRGAAAAGSANDISAALTGRVKHDYDEAIARYQELGITDPHAFAARIQELGATPKLADVEGGVEGAKKDLYAFDWITAINRLSRQVIQEPSAMSRPRAASSPVGQFVYGIMSFNYEQWRNVWKGEFMRARQRAKRSGKGFTAEKFALGFVPAFAAVILGSIGVTIVREYLTNQQRFQKAFDEGDWLPKLALLGGTRAVGTPFDPILQAFTGMKYNRDPALALLGPTLGSMGQNIKDILAEFTRDGKSNTSEHNAIRGAYRLISPWAVAGLAALPGGPAVSALYGVASAAVTAPGSGEAAGDLVVGPKKKRKKPKRPRD